ncbi:E3 ubiquitin-protein ligase TRIM32-like [Homarus americanus]|uniref:Peptidyl-prolyl cis-trans isomerase A2-like n=1 Tax=Homarus americanus TaxID=6706 RepID=A0A8J5TAL4_HOMAM|nr:E3 ubiquitin-protein ligase TRIM32-like [Homarus americanus]XP_042217205.1 E3 ubiquitin-protein ligase TRIM32-like [Homarus americanus]KAG7171572.1 Peptidyl-prolyl cis-trans isomerase A2-like [Homarus americanus]
MEESELRCEVCRERYGEEERAPRNLGCGHSMCTLCVGQLIDGDHQAACPECQAPFSALRISDTVVNYPLLRLIRALDATKIDKLQKLPQQEEEVVQQTSKSSFPNQSSLSDTAAVGECRVHRIPLSSMCMRCSVLLCQECLSLDHYPPPRGQCRTLAVTQAIAEIKSSQLQAISSKMVSINALKLKLEREISSLSSTKEQHTTTASRLNTLLQAVEDSFRDLESKLDLQNEEAVKKLAEIESILEMLRQTECGVERAKTPRDILSALEVGGDCLNQVEECLTQEQHRQVPALPRIISREKQNLREVLETGRSIYTSREVGGRRRWARVTRQDEMLHLHALQVGAHAPHGVTVPYKMVRQLVPCQCASIFLDVGIGGVLHGRVYVRMFGDTPRTRQTMLLCSGEQGPSYRGTCFFKVEKQGQPWETLLGGDYEHNRGTGGRNLVYGVTDGGVYKTEVVTGLMASGSAKESSKLAQFYFYLRQIPGSYDNGGHGIVTSGLDTLRAASRHYPITDSLVQDCGLVIPS